MSAKTCKNRLEMNTFYMRLREFVETSLKKRAKNCVFVSNFHFGKCVQNTSQNNLEINAFCMRFEIHCEGKFKKKRAKSGVFVSNFHCCKCLQNPCNNRFEITAF